MDHRDEASAGEGEGQAEAGGGERIAKVLARAGVASRREVERLIEAGRVALNGEVLRSPAVKVSARDQVTLDGKLVAAAEPTRLFRYHKPPGLVTAHSDPQGRPTVFQALPPGLPRLISVGRLDLNSEGLLLLTNDGELARQLELPATGLTRRYRARAHGRIDPGKLARLADGITVDGVRYGPIEAETEPGREGAANQWIGVMLTEGKNREVRKVLEAIGLAVNRLIRVSYGPYELGSLEKGAVEELPPPARGADGALVLAPGRPGRRYKAKSPPKRVENSPSPSSPREGEAKKKYKAGWARAKAPRLAKAATTPKAGKGPKAAKAKVRPSGSRSADARPAGPRGPTRSASRPGSSPARPPGPPRGGGPKRRG
jgi:23S rRNA pseudouridine2605 synthase